MGYRYIELKNNNSKWQRALNVSSTAALSKQIKAGKWNELVMLSELMQERNISRIADEVFYYGLKKKMILISGPSSSGKTTFAKRLSLHLKVLGLQPVIISLDNYYLARNLVPVDHEGNPDFEHIEALDLELLDNNLSDLIAGNSVTLPVFDFKIGKRRPNVHPTSLLDNNIMIIEGIHSLNDKLAKSIPDDLKYKIFICPASTMYLSGLNAELNPDSIRFIRRMVRDSQFRNSCVNTTIAMWSSVRRGEDAFIYPFMESADVMFNTHMAYELCVLRPFAQALLMAVTSSHHAWLMVRELLKILCEFPSMSDNTVPGNSILREFIGNSFFKY